MRKVIILFTVLIFTSHSNSQGWVQQNSGALMANFYDVKMLNASTAFVTGFYPDGYGWVYRTTNSGANWSLSYQTVNPLNELQAISFSSANFGTAVGGGIFGNGSFMIRTTNGGTSWFTQTTGTGFYHLAVQMIDNNLGYVCGYSGTVFRTTDGGATWSQQTSGTTRRLYGISFVNSTTGMAVGDTGTIIRTTNGGTNWSAQTSPVNASLYEIFMLDANTGMCTGTSGTILKTTNGGAVWLQLNSGISVTLRALSYINSNVCFVAGAAGTILKTTNGGMNWVPQISTLTQSLGGITFIDTSTGTAVGDNGKIIRTTNGGVTLVRPVSTEIPGQFSLEQNYPNPFNPATKIRFQIPDFAFVNLKIYDVIGRPVAVITDENLRPGSYEVDFDGSNLPSGVYVYKIAAGSFTASKKMILIK